MFKARTHHYRAKFSERYSSLNKGSEISYEKMMAKFSKIQFFIIYYTYYELIVPNKQISQIYQGSALTVCYLIPAAPVISSGILRYETYTARARAFPIYSCTEFAATIRISSKNSNIFQHPRSRVLRRHSALARKRAYTIYRAAHCRTLTYRVTVFFYSHAQSHDFSTYIAIYTYTGRKVAKEAQVCSLLLLLRRRNGKLSRREPRVSRGIGETDRFSTLTFFASLSFSLTRCSFRPASV